MLSFGELADISHHRAIFASEIFLNKLLKIALWLIPNCISQQSHSSCEDKPLQSAGSSSSTALGKALRGTRELTQRGRSRGGLRNSLSVQRAVTSMAIPVAGLGLCSRHVPTPRRFGKGMKWTQNSWPEAGGSLGGKPRWGGEPACRRRVIRNFVCSNLRLYMPETSLPF